MTEALWLAALALIGVLLIARRRRGRRRPPPVRSAPPPDAPVADDLSRERFFAEMADKVGYRARPVLHPGEAALFRRIDQRCREGWRLVLPVRVLAQVNMGEFLGVDDRGPGSPRQREAGQGAINSKRVDILLTTEDFRPLVAVEYQGRRHAADDRTRLRDRAKHAALAAAGVALVEITPGESEDDWMPRLHRALRGAHPAAFPAGGR